MFSLKDSFAGCEILFDNFLSFGPSKNSFHCFLVPACGKSATIGYLIMFLSTFKIVSIFPH